MIISGSQKALPIEKPRLFACFIIHVSIMYHSCINFHINLFSNFSPPISDENSIKWSFFALHGSQQPKWENWNHWSSFYAHTSVSVKFLAKISSGTLISKISSHFSNSQNIKKRVHIFPVFCCKNPWKHRFENIVSAFWLYLWLFQFKT